MDESPWLVVARKELGVHETPGTVATPRINEYLHEVGLSGDETAWCAAFVGWVLGQCGLVPTGKANARSYLTWGEVCEPKIGAIAVFRRGTSAWQGHVGFVVGITPTHLDVLGGNQGDAVSVRRFPRKILLGCRWPKARQAGPAAL